jgi:hypothetical protein
VLLALLVLLCYLVDLGLLVQVLVLLAALLQLIRLDNHDGVVILRCRHLYRL